MKNLDMFSADLSMKEKKIKLIYSIFIPKKTRFYSAKCLSPPTKRTKYFEQ